MHNATGYEATVGCIPVPAVTLAKQVNHQGIQQSSWDVAVSTALVFARGPFWFFFARLSALP